MKRSGLRPDPDKVRAWIAKSRQKNTLKRTEGLQRAPLTDARGTRGRKTRRGTSGGCTQAQWYEAKGDRCVCCDRRGSGLQQHHVVYEQHVVAAGGDIWDPRNGLTVCVDCHDAHHARTAVIGVWLLQDAALEFAADTLGSGPAYEYFRRRYDVGDDLRVLALLDPATGIGGTP